MLAPQFELVAGLNTNVSASNKHFFPNKDGWQAAHLHIIQVRQLVIQWH